jgi:phosphinothricin acetyltransferase
VSLTFSIREANSSDLQGIVDVINSRILEKFNGILEEDVISSDSRIEWFSQFSTNGPYRIFVACKDQNILGYTCSFKYRDHKTFNKTVETSIYTCSTNIEKGVGSALYSELFKILSKEDVSTVLIGIAQPNEASLKIHKKFGFTEIGLFKDYFYLRGGYVSSLWMQKNMSTHK